MPLQSKDFEISNRILLALPREMREQLLWNSEMVELPAGHVLYHADDPVKYAYFINSGLVSLVKNTKDGRSTEVGVVGVDGIAGPCAAGGVDYAMLEYIVQLPVTALRIKRATLREQMLRSHGLRNAIEHYLFVLIDQLSQMSVCHRLHSLGQRCCRWLLVAQDNIKSDSIPITHEFLASLLGVQRPSVSSVMNSLQRRGIIRSAYSRVIILDRAGLERSSCECYAAMRKRTDTLFRPRAVNFHSA